MTRIAFFLPSLAGGGAERACLNLAAGLLARGLEVDLVLARRQGALLGEAPASARLVDLHAGRTFSAILPLSGYIRQERPYATIAAPDHANLVAIWASLLCGSRTRVVVTNHTRLSKYMHSTGKLQERIYPRLMRIFQRHAHAIVSVSRGAAEDFARVTSIRPARITTIHNPIVPADLGIRLASPLDHPWFKPGQPAPLLSLGRLETPKDYPTLLRAFALVRSRRAARLVILGEGSQRGMLIALGTELGISADLDLPGFEPNPFRYLSRSSVFVFSSAWEGFSNVLVEALASGTQVVSSDCPSGPAEILGEGSYGWLVPVGDPVAMARAIESALDQPLPAAVLKARAEDFSVEAITEQYLKMLGLS